MRPDPLRPNDTALITGASSGLGAGFAARFAADSVRLVLVARRRERLEELAAELRTVHGVDVHVIVADLSVPSAGSKLIEALDELKRDSGVEVDWLVNNAGFGLRGRVAELAHDAQAEMIRLNIETLTSLSRHCVSDMLERDRGGILNVASVAGFVPGPYMSVYYATKAYVVSFTEALAHELRDSGVSVTCLSPGATKTEFGEVSGMADSLGFRLGARGAERVIEAGYRGLKRGKLHVIPGVLNKLTIQSLRLTPRWLTRRVVSALQSPDEAS